MKKQKKQKKGRAGTVLLVVCILVGLSLLLYPTLSNYWNTVYSTHAISVYSEKMTQLTEDEYADIWEAARSYNQGIRYSHDSHALKEGDKKRYEELLNIDGSGVMGYIEIPNIEVILPIAHGTSDEVLQKGVGHVEWSSLPVGGKSTHSVLSSHRGLPSAKLFTNLDQVAEGDTFTLHILNEVLTYEVDQIRTVLPEETSDLAITDGKDYCTLVTCTPYGVNSHRLLVRGHRVESEEPELQVTSEAIIIEPLIVAPLLAVPMLIIVFIFILLLDKQKKHLTMEEEDNVS